MTNVVSLIVTTLYDAILTVKSWIPLKYHFRELRHNGGTNLAYYKDEVSIRL